MNEWKNDFTLYPIKTGRSTWSERPELSRYTLLKVHMSVQAVVGEEAVFGHTPPLKSLGQVPTSALSPLYAHIGEQPVEHLHVHAPWVCYLGSRQTLVW